MEKQAELTEAEERYFERAREAEEQGLTLTQYYRASGLSLEWLYNTRRRLIRKGLVSSRRGLRGDAAKEAGFLEVQVAGVSRGEGDAVCRVRHPSGWVIECCRWPEARWMVALLGERS